MIFTNFILLVYIDNGSVQTLCIRRVMFKVFAQSNCQYKPKIHKGWNWFNYIILCVSITFIFRIQGYAQWMEDPKNSALRQKPCYHRYTEKFNISQSLICFNNDSCFQTNLQHNYSEENDQYAMSSTSVNGLQHDVNIVIACLDHKRKRFKLFCVHFACQNNSLDGIQVYFHIHVTHMSSDWTSKGEILRTPKLLHIFIN